MGRLIGRVVEVQYHKLALKSTEAKLAPGRDDLTVRRVPVRSHRMPSKFHSQKKVALRINDLILSGKDSEPDCSGHPLLSPERSLTIG